MRKITKAVVVLDMKQTTYELQQTFHPSKLTRTANASVETDINVSCLLDHSKMLAKEEHRKALNLSTG